MVIKDLETLMLLIGRVERAVDCIQVVSSKWEKVDNVKWRKIWKIGKKYDRERIKLRPRSLISHGIRLLMIHNQAQKAQEVAD